MQLPEIEPLELQMAQAHLDLLRDVLGAAEWMPLVGAGAQKAGFGRDHEAGLVGRERFADELFAYIRAVRVCGVDEVDAELDGAAQDALGFFTVPGLAPDAFAGDAHCAETEAMNFQIAAEPERGWGLGCSGHAELLHQAF